MSSLAKAGEAQFKTAQSSLENLGVMYLAEKPVVGETDVNSYYSNYNDLNSEMSYTALVLEENDETIDGGVPEDLDLETSDEFREVFSKIGSNFRIKFHTYTVNPPDGVGLFFKFLDSDGNEIDAPNSYINGHLLNGNNEAVALEESLTVGGYLNGADYSWIDCTMEVYNNSRSPDGINDGFIFYRCLAISGGNAGGVYAFNLRDFYGILDTTSLIGGFKLQTNNNLIDDSRVDYHLETF